MTAHEADCADCAWTYRSDDLVEVSDALERHSRKEQHHVELKRAVATDGGRPEGQTTFDGDIENPTGGDARDA
jgi:hypothetical protein